MQLHGLGKGVRFGVGEEENVFNSKADLFVFVCFLIKRRARCDTVFLSLGASGKSFCRNVESTLPLKWCL